MGPVKLHVPAWRLQWSKAILRIKTVRIPGQKNPAAQILQRGVLDNALYQPFAQTAAAMGFEHEYVAKIGERGKITYDSGESDLRERTGRPMSRLPLPDVKIPHRCQNTTSAQSTA